jgi:hypothetical protein
MKTTGPERPAAEVLREEEHPESNATGEGRTRRTTIYDDANTCSACGGIVVRPPRGGRRCVRCLRDPAPRVLAQLDDGTERWIKPAELRGAS